MGKKAKSTHILILILIILVVFIALDLILAKVFVKASDRTFRTSHPYYHHDLIPNQRAIASWYNIRYPIYTNSLGFRDQRVREVPLQTSKRRILFIGDSHTEGVGMHFEDTFTGQLIAQTDTSKLEILNAAAVSYSLRTYYLKVRYLLEIKKMKFDELFVFIDLSDLQNEIVYQNFEPSEISHFATIAQSFKNKMINRSFTIHTLPAFRQARQTKRFLEKAEIFDEYRQNEDHVDALELYASFFRDFDDKTLLSNPQFHGVAEWIYDEDFVELAKMSLGLGAENMDKLYKLCLEHNIPITISVHPWQTQIALKQTEDLYVTFWKDFAQARDIGFINLYETFINPPVSAAFGLEFFIPGDNHWNRNGHALVAREVLKHISGKD